MYTVIGNDGNEYGPVDALTLQSWIQNGRVAPASQVIDPIDGMRKPAATIPEIARFFPPGGGFQPPSTPVNPYNVTVNVQAAQYGPPKSKLVAILLAFFLGYLGIHRFYLGHTGTGVAMLLITLFGWILLGIPYIALGIWVLVDIILIATGALREANGRELAN